MVNGNSFHGPIPDLSNLNLIGEEIKGLILDDSLQNCDLRGQDLCRNHAIPDKCLVDDIPMCSKPLNYYFANEWNFESDSALVMGVFFALLLLGFHTNFPMKEQCNARISLRKPRKRKAVKKADF